MPGWPYAKKGKCSTAAQLIWHVNIIVQYGNSMLWHVNVIPDPGNQNRRFWYLILGWTVETPPTNQQCKLLFKKHAFIILTLFWKTPNSPLYRIYIIYTYICTLPNLLFKNYLEIPGSWRYIIIFSEPDIAITSEDREKLTTVNYLHTPQLTWKVIKLVSWLELTVTQ